MLAVLVTGSRLFGTIPLDVSHKHLPKKPTRIVWGEFDRDFWYQTPAFELVEAIFKGAKQMPEVVIHGDAYGADTIAAIVAEELELTVLDYPYPSQHGKAGGPIRNAEMLGKLKSLKEEGYDTEVWAFHEQLSKKGGTGNMVRMALNADVPVYWFRPLDVKEGVWMTSRFAPRRVMKLPIETTV